MPVKYTKEVLESAVRESFSIMEVLRRLGVGTNSGGMHYHISRRIKSLQLDTTHFTGIRSNRGRMCNGERMLVAGAKKQHSDRLRKALLATGREEVCEICGQDPAWNGKPLRLPIDHVDGDNTNNQPENLRFLCPNCHSQTETYAKTKTFGHAKTRSCSACGGHICKTNTSGLCYRCRPSRFAPTASQKYLKLRRNSCLVCGKPAKNKFCSYKCARHASLRTVWPNDLTEQVAAASVSVVARRLGVSGSAVRKRLRSGHGESRTPTPFGPTV